MTNPRDLEAVLADLRAALTADAAGKERRRRPFWRRRFVTLALVPALFGIGGGAWALTELRGEDLAHAIACHSEASLKSSVTGVLEADGRDPVEACAESMWPGGGAPELVACANREHSVVDVFPSRDPGVCAELGLAALPDGYRAGARRTRALLVELHSRLSRKRCYGEAEAAAIGRAVLDRHGFRGWRFKTIGFGRLYGEDRFCATGDMVWLGSTDERTAGVTGAKMPAFDPPEAVLEAPGCRGAEQAAALLSARLAQLPDMPFDRVEIEATADRGLPCSEYGVVDWGDAARPAVVIGQLGPPAS